MPDLFGSKVSTSQDQVHLRKFALTDVQRLFDLIEENRDFLRESDDPTAENYLSFRSVMESIETPRSDLTCYGIWWGNELVGSLNMISQKHVAAIEIGYWLSKKFLGIGIATFAVRRALHIAFAKQKAAEVFARVGPWNERSIAVLRRTAFLLDHTQSTDEELRYVFTREQYFGGLRT